jgi:hypothetical protein
MSSPSEQSPDLLVRFAIVVAAAAIALAVLPSLLGGVVIGEMLRRHAMRWTWPALLAAISVPLAAGAALVAGVPPDGAPAPQIALVSLAWIAATPVLATAWMLHRGHHDRLHGGEREQRAVLARGPLDALQRRRARQDTALVSDHGILLGHDSAGLPVRVLRPQAHTTIVGASNSGKTNTAARLLEAHVATGGGFLVLDGKGGRDLATLAVALGARHRRQVSLWSISPYGLAELDRQRRPWNPGGDGNPTEIKDRIASSEEQSEPYYAAIASRGLLAACRALTATKPAVRLDDLADLLDQPLESQAGRGKSHASGAGQ